MDLFGKTLVLVNLALSLAMAAIGGAVLYYHVDWTDNAATDSQPAGMLLAREDDYQKLGGFVLNAQSRVYDKRVPGMIDAADAAWRQARTALLAQEDRRKKDQAWYAEELQHLRTDPKKQPIQELVFDKGRTAPDPNNGGLPLMKPTADRYGQPLKPLVAYIKEQQDIDAQVTTVLTDLDKAVTDDAEATMHLLGSKRVRDWFPHLKDEYKDDDVRKRVQDKLTALAAKLKDERGLIQRIADESVKQDGVAKEMELVLLAEGQVRADSQLLLIRKRALEARVKELEKTAVTAAQP